MSTQPIYITITQIATTLGYISPSNIRHLINKWQNDRDLPTPPPDAHLVGKRGTPTPLWLQERLPEWETWNEQRIALTHQRQREGLTLRGRPPGPSK